MQNKNEYIKLKEAIVKDANMRLEQLKEEKERLEKENVRLKVEIAKNRERIELLKILNKPSEINFEALASCLSKKRKYIEEPDVISTEIEEDKIEEDKINEIIEHTLEKCPNCNKTTLEKTGKVIQIFEKDYKLSVINRIHQYIEYKCLSCEKIVNELVPEYLKEDNCYGNNVKSLALILANIENIPFNKIRKIISGLTMGQINLTEGYLAKLQKQASKLLSNFTQELNQKLIKSSQIYSEDIVVTISGKQSYIRCYKNDSFCLYNICERKNNEKANYIIDYRYTNAKLCEKLIKDLKEIKENIPERTWCNQIIELFQEYNNLRNKLIKEKTDFFTLDEIDKFIITIDACLIDGLEENENNSKSNYSEKELELLYSIIEYRDNYIYWILDFTIPFNNFNEKIKESLQFQNKERVIDYINIKSYIDTCKLYGKDEYDCLSRMFLGNPYTFEELQFTVQK